MNISLVLFLAVIAYVLVLVWVVAKLKKGSSSNKTLMWIMRLFVAIVALWIIFVVISIFVLGNLSR